MHEELHEVDEPETLPLKQSINPSVHVGALALAEMTVKTSPPSSAPAEIKIPASTAASTPPVSETFEPSAVVTPTKDDESDGALSALP